MIKSLVLTEDRPARAQGQELNKLEGMNLDNILSLLTREVTKGSFEDFISLNCYNL